MDLAEPVQKGHGQERELLTIPSPLRWRVLALVVRCAAFGVEQAGEVVSIGDCGGGPGLLLARCSARLSRVGECSLDLRDAFPG
jgi:hypothetical protein